MANLEPDFSFDDDEIRAALESEENGLVRQNTELARQVENLEGMYLEDVLQLYIPFSYHFTSWCLSLSTSVILV